MGSDDSGIQHVPVIFWAHLGITQNLPEAHRTLSKG